MRETIQNTNGKQFHAVSLSGGKAVSYTHLDVYKRQGLAPRCRLVTSWGCIRSQGFGCSPIKVARELGSERRETVRSLSVAGERDLKGAVLSTRGPGWTYLWCTSCPAKGIAG